jgi:chaperonin GroEL (HSP60 family)
MADDDVVEPRRVKEKALESATDVASMVPHLDDVIAAKGFDEDDEGRDLDV